ncbi:MAG: hypothetical protein ABIQ44_10155, partial [Chloroflexia bacterium]
NEFVDCNVGIQFGGGDRAAGAGWSRLTILDNDINVPNGGSGIDVYGEAKFCVFVGNHILVKGAGASGFGFRMFPLEANKSNANTSNLFGENFVSPQLQNIIPSHAAYGYKNTSGEKTPLNFAGVASPFIDDIITAGNAVIGNTTVAGDNSSNGDNTPTITVIPPVPGVLNWFSRPKNLSSVSHQNVGPSQSTDTLQRPRTERGNVSVGIAGAGKNSNGGGSRVAAGGGTIITVVVNNLDLGEAPEFGASEVVVRVPGAVVGDPVTLARPADTLPGIVYDAVVSAPDSVVVRANNYSNRPKDPTPGSFTITLIKH